MPLVSPVASILPSGLNATVPTPWVPLAGSVSVAFWSLVAASHR